MQGAGAARERRRAVEGGGARGAPLHGPKTVKGLLWRSPKVPPPTHPPPTNPPRSAPAACTGNTVAPRRGMAACAACRGGTYPNAATRASCLKCSALTDGQFYYRGFADTT